jgi:hypothetical protein
LNTGIPEQKAAVLPLLFFGSDGTIADVSYLYQPKLNS